MKRSLKVIGVLSSAVLFSGCGGGGISSGGGSNSSGSGSIVAEQVAGTYDGSTTLHVALASGNSYDVPVSVTIVIASNDNLTLDLGNGMQGTGAFTGRYTFQASAPIAPLLSDRGVACAGGVVYRGEVGHFDAGSFVGEIVTGGFSGSFASDNAVCAGSPATISGDFSTAGGFFYKSRASQEQINAGAGMPQKATRKTPAGKRRT